MLTELFITKNYRLGFGKTKACLLVIALMFFSLSHSIGQTIYGLGESMLVSFEAKTPNIIQSTIAWEGLPGGMMVSGFDIRPATGELYVLGYHPSTGAARLFTLDAENGMLSAVGSGNFTINPGIEQLTLDFNPTVDRIRILGSDGSNLRAHPETGMLVATDGMLAFNSGDVNEGQVPVVAAGAYTNSFAGSTSTVLYDYDIAQNLLLSQIPPNDGKLNTIGASGIMLDADRPTIDIDIFFSYRDSSNTAFALASLMGTSCDQFFEIDLSTGMSRLIGPIGGEEPILKIAAMLDEPLPPGIGFKANLSGRNEVFPIVTLASGELLATLRGNILTVEGAFMDLSEPINLEIAGGAHIHRGLAGQNGPVEFLLTVSEGPDANSGVFKAEDNTFELSEEQVDLLLNRAYYVNIHSNRFHSGELRGQLVPEAAQLFVSNLFGSNEVPAIVSEGFGAVVAELIGDTLTISGSFSDLEGDFAAQIAGGAHVHVGLAGENGGIAFHLHTDVSEDLKSGVFLAEHNKVALSEDQKQALLNSGLYVNIHTSIYNAGELRGQLTMDNQFVMRAHLSGYNEYPFVTSLGGGQIIAEVVGNELRVSGTFSNLTSAINPNIAGGVHLHIGMAGVNGGILAGLNPQLSSDGKSGRFEAAENIITLDEEQLDLFLNRAVYINIHTEEAAAGELRGQFLNESQYYMNAYLTGSQEVPQVLTPGNGAVAFEISGNVAVASGAFQGMDGSFAEEIAGGAHIHMGYAGQNGGILSHLHADLDGGLKSGSFRPDRNRMTLNAEQKNAIKNREAYVNIHTSSHPSGELRGNLVGEAAIYAYAWLGGTSEVAPVITEGMGAVGFEISADKIVASGSFVLASMFAEEIAGGAHIHMGMAGKNGGIAFHLHADTNGNGTAGVFEVASNSKEITEEFLNQFMMRNLYVNIHTEAHPSGEIRGQMLPLANAYFHANLMGLNEVPAVMSNGFGSVKGELTDKTLTLSGTFSDLTGDFDPAIAGGAHVHMGLNGENGGIAFHLHTELESGNKAGIFMANNNIIELNQDQLTSLMNGSLYVNIHTTAHASGELRGQLLKEVNFTPSPTLVVNPEDGLVLELMEISEGGVSISWSNSIDINDDAVSYIWQASMQPDFSDLMVSMDNGLENSFDIAAEDFISLIDTSLFEMMDTIMIFHRVISRDGSDFNIGETAVLSLINSGSSNIIENGEAAFDLSIFPTIGASNVINARINSDIQSVGHFVIMNQNAQIITKLDMTALQGQTDIQIPVSNLSSGVYFGFFTSGKFQSRIRKFIIQ